MGVPARGRRWFARRMKQYRAWACQGGKRRPVVVSPLNLPVSNVDPLEQRLLLTTTLYWDTNGAAAGLGGTGTWDLSTANWTPDATGSSATQSWDNGGTAVAVFGDAAGTVSISGTVGAAILEFDTAGYLLQGGTLSLPAGGTTLDIEGSNVSINSTLAGGGALTKTGAGSATLGAASTFTGLTTVSAGTLGYGINNALGAGAVTVSGPAAVLDLATFSDSVGAVTLDNGGQITGTTGVLTSTATYAVKSGSVSAILAGGVGLTKSTGGTVTLSGANTYTGVTTISAGTLSVSSLANGGAASNIGQSSNAAANLVLGGGTLQYTGSTVSTNRNFTLTSGTTSTLDIASGTNLTISGAGTATSGALTKIGAGTLTLAGANTFTGLTTVNAGTLAYGVNNALATGAVTVIGSTAVLDIGSFSDTVAGVTLDGGATITGSTGVLSSTGGYYAARDGTISAILSGSAGLQKSTTGTVTVTRANTYTGVTTVGAGTLSVSSLANGGVASNIGQATNAPSNLALSGGTLLYTGATTSIDRGFTPGGAVSVPSGVELTISGSSPASAGGITKIGAGTLILSGSNAYTWSTNVNEGTLRVGANEAMPDLSPVNVAAGATFDLNGFNDTVGAISGSGSIALGAGTLTAGAFNSSTTFYGVMSGAGAFTKTGTGTLTLSGVNTYTGPTTVSAGTLKDNVTNGFSDASAVTVGPNGTLSFSTAATDTIGSLSGSGNVTNSSWSLSIGADNSDTLFSGVISGIGPLSKVGSGRLTLSGSNTDTGAININAGTLALAIDNAIATGNTINIGAGSSVGTLDLGSASQQVASLNFQSNSASVNSVVIGSGRTLTVTGASVVGVTPTTASTTTNAAVTGLGTLTINTASNFSVGAVGTATFANSASLDLSGLSTFNATVGELRVGYDTTANTAGVGSSTLTLAGANTITATKIDVGDSSRSAASALKLGAGANVINADTINVGVHGSTGKGSGTLAFNGGAGSLQVRARDGVGRAALTVGSTTGAAAVAMTDAVDLSGHAANLLLNTLTIGNRNNNTATSTGLTAALTFDQGTLDATTITLAVKAGSNTDTVSGTLNVAGGTVLVGSGGLKLGTQTGSGTGNGAANLTGGTITLNGDIIDGGGTTPSSLLLNGATLDMTSHAIGGATLINTLTLASGTLKNVAQINGGGTITISGSLFTLSGTNSYTGATTVSAGVLKAGSAGGLSPNSAMTVNATLDVNGFDAVVRGLNGAGTIENDGVSDATLHIASGASGSYSGVLQDGTHRLGIELLTGAYQVFSGVSTYSGATVFDTSSFATGGFTTSGFSANSAYSLAAGSSLSIYQNAQIGSLSGFGTIQAYTSTPVVLTVGGNNQSTSFAGALGFSMTSGKLLLTKTGSGSMVLSGSDPYVGNIVAHGGILEIDASCTTSAQVSVDSGAILSGTGTVGPVVVAAGGTLAPGISGVGILNTGSLTLASGANLVVQISGDAEGAGYGVVNAIGAVSVAGANLLPTATRADHDNTAVVLARNESAGAAAVTGSFVGLAEGTTLTLGGVLYRLTYQYNEATGTLTGHDVALIDVPQPTATGDSYTVLEDHTLVANDVDGSFTVDGNDNGVLANDHSNNPGHSISVYAVSVTTPAGTVTTPIDADGETVSTARGGTLRIWPNGHFTYTPPSFFGIDAAGAPDYANVYVITDGLEQSSPAALVFEIDAAPLHLTALPFTAPEGSAADVVVATFTDDSGNTFNKGIYSATIAWGDGRFSSGDIVRNTTGGFNVLGEPGYQDHGVYTTGVTLTKSKGGVLGASASASGVATVTAEPPTNIQLRFASDLSAPLEVDQGATTGFVVTFDDPGSPDVFDASVNWGDGSSVQNLTSIQSGFAVSHQFLNSGSTNVTATIHNALVSATQTTAFSVRNAPPSSLEINAEVGTDPGTAVVSGAFVDPGTADHHTAVIDWGDGADPAHPDLTTLHTGAGVTSFGPVNHVYAMSGVYTVSTTVVDDAMTSSPVSAQNQVTVTAAPPTTSGATLHASSVTEGQSYNITLLADGAPPNAWRIDWGDGTVEPDWAGATSSVNHTYADGPSQHVVRVFAVDSGGTATPVPLSPAEASLQHGGLSADDQSLLSHYNVQMARMADGEVFAAGSHLNVGQGFDFAVRRFDTEGQPVVGSEAAVDFGYSNDIVRAVIVGADQKIFVVGQTDALGDQDLAIARFNVDGSIDTDFGTGGTGRLVVHLPGNQTIRDAAIDGNGNLVVAGTDSGAGGSDMLLLRLSSAGVLDASFATAGIAKLDFAGNNDAANSIVINGDGDIVLAGTTATGTGPASIALAKLDPQGVPDTSFGDGNGKSVLAWSGGTVRVTGLRLDSAGRLIVVAARAENSSPTDSAVAVLRFATDGQPDLAFGGGLGRTIVNPDAGLDEPHGVSVTSNGDIFVSGDSVDPVSGQSDLLLLHFLANGTPDTGFGSGGWARSDWSGGQDYGYAMLPGAAGNLLVASAAPASPTSELLLTPFTALGQPLAHLVSVRNVVPTLLLTGPGTINEGQDYTLNLGAHDPGADTLQEWIINWGDGSTQPVAGDTTTVSHVYNIHQVSLRSTHYAITAVAADEDGRYSATGPVVSVNNLDLAAPTGLSASFTWDPEQVMLSWTDVQGANSYEVDRGLDPTHMSKIAESSSAEYFDDVDVLDTDTTYYYRVIALNADHQSDPSGLVTARTSPTALNAPDELRVEESYISDQTSRLTLYWDAVTGATGYIIYRDDFGAAPGDIPYATVGDVTQFADETADAHSRYVYRIAAMAGNVTSYEASVVTLVTPQILSLTADDHNNTLSFPPTDYNDYAIYRSEDPSAFPNVPLTLSNQNYGTSFNYVDEVPDPSKVYYYQVHEIDGSGHEGLGAVFAATVVNATASAGKIDLTWTAVPGAVNYDVYRGASIYSSGDLLQAGVASTTYSDSSVLDTEEYTYAIVAHLSQGSTTSKPTALQSPVMQPITDLHARVRDGGVLLTYTGETGQVYRSTTPFSLGTYVGAQLLSPGVSLALGAPSGTYYYTMVNYDSAGHPISSNVASVVVPAATVPVPGEVSDIHFMPDGSAYWDPVPDANSYKIYRRYPQATGPLHDWAYMGDAVANGDQVVFSTVTRNYQNAGLDWKVAAINSADIPGSFKEFSIIPVNDPTGPTGIAVGLASLLVPGKYSYVFENQTLNATLHLTNQSVYGEGYGGSDLSDSAFIAVQFNYTDADANQDPAIPYAAGALRLHYGVNGLIHSGDTVEITPNYGDFYSYDFGFSIEGLASSDGSTITMQGLVETRTYHGLDPYTSTFEWRDLPSFTLPVYAIPGQISAVGLNYDDKDADGIIDSGDGFNADKLAGGANSADDVTQIGAGAGSFAPLTITLPTLPDVDLSKVRISLGNSAVRLWSRDENAARTSLSILSEKSPGLGHAILPGTYSLDELGFSGNTVTLYEEGVQSGLAHVVVSVDFGNGIVTDASKWTLVGGGLLRVNNNDDDGDGVVDFADGYNLDGQRNVDPASVAYLDDLLLNDPDVVHVASLAFPSSPATHVRLDFSESDPSQVARTGAGTAADPFVYTPAGGTFRVWGGADRSIEPYEGDPPPLLWLTSGTTYAISDVGGLSVEAVNRSSGPATIHYMLTDDAGAVVTSGDMKFKVFDPDLVIDADNNNGSASPDGGPADEQMEDGALSLYPTTNPANFQWTGKIIPLNNEDLDHDGVADMFDGFNFDGVADTAGGSTDDKIGQTATATPTHLIPIKIELPAPIDLRTAQLSLSYSASDPRGVTRSDAAALGFLLPGQQADGTFGDDLGYLRLWTSPGDPATSARSASPFFTSGADLSSTGYYVPPTGSAEHPYYTAADLAQLGFTDANRTVTLYIEAIRPSAAVSDQQVQMTVFPMGTSSESAPQYSDSVHVTLGLGDLAVDSNNNQADDRVRDDQVESIGHQPGLVLLVNDGDRNADGIVDFAQGYSNGPITTPNPPTMTQGMGSMQFSMPHGIDLSHAKFAFVYDAADPTVLNTWTDGSKTAYGLNDTGSLRIWLGAQPASPTTIPSRDGHDLGGGGTFVKPMTAYTAEQLGLAVDGSGAMSRQFLIEAVRASAKAGDLGVSVYISFDGTGTLPGSGGTAGTTPDPAHWVPIDAVQLTAIEATRPDAFSGFVRLDDGSVSYMTSDLFSTAFAGPTGFSRTYTTRPLLENGQAAPGWSFDLPHVVAASGSMIVASGSGERFFDYDAASSTSTKTVYKSRFEAGAVLVVANGYITLNESDGSQWRFAGLGGDPFFPAPSGAFEFYTPFENGIGFRAQYEAGRMASLFRGIDEYDFLYEENKASPAYGMVREIDRVRGPVIEAAVYNYYPANSTDGHKNDLREVRTYKVDSENNRQLMGITEYRYDTSTDQSRLKMVVGPAGVERWAGVGGNSTDSVTGATAASLAAYADVVFEYDSQGRVHTQTLQGAGALDATTQGSGGDFTYTYDAEPHHAAGVNVWRQSVKVLEPGAQYEHSVYTNFLGETMVDVVNETETVSGVPRKWITYARFDNAGRTVLTADAAAVTGYDPAKQDLVGGTTDDYFDLVSDDAGQVTQFDYFGSGDPYEGLLKETTLKHGDHAAATAKLGKVSYAMLSTNDPAQKPIYVSSSTVYGSESGDREITTTFERSFVSGRVVVKTTLPAVADGAGSSHATTVFEVLNSYGLAEWTLDASGSLTYAGYDSNGVRAFSVIDSNAQSVYGLPSAAAALRHAAPYANVVTSLASDDFGRVKSSTDAMGRTTYFAYKEADDKSSVTASFPDGRQSITVTDRRKGYAAAAEVTDQDDDLASPSQGSVVTSLSRVSFDVAGRTLSQDDFVNVLGVMPDLSNVATYTAAIVADPNHAPSVNDRFYRTTYGYDGSGRNDTVVDAVGTKTQTEFDVLGRVAAVKVGVGSSLTTVATYEYDHNGVGNGNVTKSTAIPGGGAADRITQSFYDWRDRPILTVSGNADVLATTPSTYLKYDNLGQVIERDAVVGTDPFNSAPSSYAGGPDASSLRGKTTFGYDDLGRVKAVTDFATDSTPPLVTTTAYDDAQRKTKTTTPDGVVTTAHYDGAGRADDVTVGDASTAFESSHTTFDADGNPTLIVSTQRQADYSLRTSYTANWYDLAGRLTDTADLGTHGGTTYTRPASPPERADDVLLTSYEYDAQGRLEFVTDPNAIITRTQYDPLNRVAATTEAYATISIDAVSNPSQNRVTKYAYNGNGQVVTQTAINIGKPDQVTQYEYGVTAGVDGNAITSNDLLHLTKSPDKESGQPSTAASDQSSRSYNALSEVIGSSDPNGTHHAYTIDNAGRVTRDAVTGFGSAGIDTTVTAHTTQFDSFGRAYLFTSLNASGAVVNQVRDEFNGYNQLTAEYQAVGGAVDPASTPSVRYGYDAAHASRLSSMTYPDGRKLNYVYDGSGASINRISGIVDDATSVHLEDYTYLGLSTIVGRSHPEVHSTLTIGLDNFGRIVDQKWTDTQTSLATDEFTYGYNRDGSVLFKENEVLPNLSELYEVDLLNRLKSYSRGALNDDFTAIANPSTVKTWDLDSLGNHDAATTTTSGDTTTQGQTTNAQNQVVTAGETQLAYDDNGNTLTDERGHTFVYDAWNHLVKQTSPSTETFTYDALGRKITVDDGDGAGAQKVYYSAQWQVLEQTTSTDDVTLENVWSVAYVDGLIEQDRDANHDGSITSSDQRLYAQQDANWNTTSLIDAITGQVVERYIYDPFGAVIILTPGGDLRATSTYAWTYLHQGGDLDLITGLYNFRHRDYSPSLERWFQSDPAFADGNFYAFGGNPTGSVDPMGTDSYPDQFKVWQAGRDYEATQAAVAAKQRAEAIAVRQRAVAAYTEQISAIDRVLDRGMASDETAAIRLEQHLLVVSVRHLNEEITKFQYVASGASWTSFLPIEGPREGAVDAFAQGHWIEGVSFSGLFVIDVVSIGSVGAALLGPRTAMEAAGNAIVRGASIESEILIKGGATEFEALAGPGFGAPAEFMIVGPSNLASQEALIGGRSASSNVAEHALIEALEDWGGANAAGRLTARDAAWEADNAIMIHGNSALSTRTAYLYGLYIQDGTFLKWGVTQNIAKRYPKSFMTDKYLVPVARGPRGDMLRMERNFVETQPGPLNREAWAGSRIGGQ
jgi:RHS repeat-associated protein/uncharacterized delta-60 repeat protein